METTEHFHRFLKERGLPFTQARKAILRGIAAAEGHFDAAELHDALKSSGERLSAATIYRTLPLFVKSGIIRETLRAEGRSRYEHAWGHDHHDHLECLGCGKIVEFKDDALESLQEKVCRKHGFAPVEHRLGIRGYCAECRKRKAGP